jgi:hypothetical protein
VRSRKSHFLFRGLRRASYKPGADVCGLGANCGGEAGELRGTESHFDPLSTRGNTRTAFAGNQIPANRINPIAQSLINLYPLPSTGGLVNNYTYQPVKTQNNDTFDARVDYRFSDSNTAFARYSFNSTNTVIPKGCPVAPNGLDPVCDRDAPGQRRSGRKAPSSTMFTCLARVW